MMKKIGCLMSIAGILVFVGAFAMFGASIWQAMDARKVNAAEVKTDAPLATDVLVVNTDKACQVAVVLELRAKAVKKTKDIDGNIEYTPKYNFPFTYSVKTSDGSEILSGKKPLSSEGGTRRILESEVTEAGGTVKIRQNLEKFDVKGPGKIKVEATIGLDTTTGAELIKAEVEVYDNVARHGKSVGIGLLMLGGGPVLLIIGILSFLAGMVFDRGQRVRRVR
jgi:hypothetical protein